MSKRFLLKDTGCPTPSTSHPTRTINWALCVLCQKDDKKKLTDPMLTKRKVVGAAYTSLAENLLKLNELNVLPRNIKIAQLDEGEGIEAALVANHARWHHACNIACNKTQVQCAEKRALEKCGSANSCKNIRRTFNQKPAEEVLCFFCCKQAGTDGLHEATTLKLDSRVRACAELLQDTYLLAQLSSGDMVAMETKYHTTCLVSLYNRARKHNAPEMGGNAEKLIVQGTALAEIIMYMEEARLDENTAPIFKLADLAHLYAVRIEQLGIKHDARVNTTRFKQRLLAQIPDLQAMTKGRDVILSFSENIGEGLTKLCEWDSDRDAVYLGHAARIVRSHMFAEPKVFTGFHAGCQRDSVPNMLLTLVNMILEGPNVSDQSEFSAASSTLTIAQLLKFNSVKHKRFEGNTTSSTVRHSTDQETPLPMYIGMMLHAKTRKRELVDRLSHMGVSISYDRVLRLSAQLGETAIKQFHKDQVVCPTHMRDNVFTTAAIDNIDHNPSSTTSKESFHGTGISLLQHPVFVGQGIDRNIAITEDSSGKKTVGHLPSYYTVVPTATSNTDKASPPPITVTSLGRENSDRHMKEEYKWLENVQKIIAPDDKENSVQETVHNISWAAYYASRQSPGMQVICQSALLPLFHESAHTVAMIKHSMAIVQKAVHYLNAGQTPVVTFDQPLYAISKQIQWTLPEMYGEDKVVVMFGGLHIEMTAMKCLGHWLKGSGWVESLIQTNITTAGIADSLLHAAHVARTRHAHQVTVAALYILQDRAYENHDKDTEDEPLGFSEWCSQREKNCPQFLYWASHAPGTVFTCLCAIPAAVFIQHVPRCFDRTRPLVFCFRPHQLCPMDPSSYP